MSKAEGKWLIVECSRGKEAACVAVLGRLGFPGGFYPQKKVDTLTGAKKKRAAIKIKTPRYVMKAWVPGYIFVPAENDRTDLINEFQGKVWLRVLAPMGKPYTVTDTDMARMRDIPERVKDLIEKIKAEERAAWEAVRPMVGMNASVLEGPFQSMTGVVQELRDGGETAVMSFGGFLSSVPIPAMHARRVA